MAEPVVNEYSPLIVSPPGETLREILDERGITQADLANRMGRPEKTVSEIINGKAAITLDTALQLGLVLGLPAGFWMAREQAYRESLARQRQVLQLESQIQWARRFPVASMVRLGYMPNVAGGAARVQALLEFFGVASPQQWAKLYGEPQVALRRSAAFKSSPTALTAWLRQGEILAQQIRCHSFSRDRFTAALKESRPLTREGPEVFVPALQQVCAGAGVAVVFVPELPKSRASGAARWMSPVKALIQLSLRYRTDDQLWFTFFHEAAHILHHGKQVVFLEGDGTEDAEDIEADRWAQDFLISPSDYKRIVAECAFGQTGLLATAEALGVSPGILVGRLQHDHVLSFQHPLSRVKRHFVWALQPDPN